MLANWFPNIVTIWPQFLQATWETVYMTFWSALIAGALGLGTGIFLVVTQPDGINADPPFYNFLDKLVNLLRSVPFIILLAVMAPITKYIVGTTVGTPAALVPLIVGIFPFYARQIQNALLSIEPSVIEAAQAMGSSTSEISVVTIISLLGLTTMAGAIGSGGLGDIAISVGYARFENDVTIAALLIILVMVFIVQVLGDWIAKKVVRF
jgi:D-methionine transport system permease protein